MGYTLEWIDLPAHVADARDASHAVWDRNEDDERTTARYFRLAEPYQLDLNAAGMGYVRTTMARLGMAFDAPLRDDDEPGSHQWTKQRADGVGIPLFKLQSNDEWIVTPEEIEEALDAYARTEEDEDDELWRTWVEWLRRTRQHGGFYVY